MKLQTLVDGLSDIINDYIEGKLDSETRGMFKKYLKEKKGLAFFIQKSYQGKIASKKSYEVKAADDFEEKLENRISALDEEAEVD